MNIGKVLCLALLLNSNYASAETVYASKERATVARAHMSRARTLLVEALAEFEEARKYARPDMLIDSEDWRLRVISLTEQLNRVIDPQPRVTRQGAVFRAPPKFVNRERDRLPEVVNGAKSRSDVGEKQYLKKKQEDRAKFFEEKENKEKSAQKSIAAVPKELKIPDEPVLETPDSEVIYEGKDSSLNDESGATKKNLFSDDLMPKVGEGEIGQGEDVNEVINDTGVPPETERNNSKLESNTANDEYDETLDGFDEELGKNSVIGSESVPKADQVRKDTEADIDMAKQFSEDEELARKLEESISEKLSNR